MHLKKPSSCVGCVLYNDVLESTGVTDKDTYERHRACRGFSTPDGSGKGGVFVLLESLGDNEVDDSLPLRPHAPAGSVFDRVLRRSGIERNVFKIDNLQRGQPPFNKLNGASYEDDVIQKCSQYWLQTLNSMPLRGLYYKERIILALGALPFRVLTGLNGEYVGINDIRGYPVDTPHGVVVGSYHPSHIIQGGQKLYGVLMHDVRKVVGLARNGFTRKKTLYQEQPSLDDARSFLYKVKDNVNLPLTVDIETPFIEGNKIPDRVDSIQFSLASGSGIYFPWYGEYIDIARDILARNNDKVGWNNWSFDNIVLEQIGGCNLGGQQWDAMWAWHHYQPDLTTEEKDDGEDSGISSRMALQYAASFFGMDEHWKYMKTLQGMQRRYAVMDVDATYRIWDGLPSAMKAVGIWDGFVSLRKGLMPVLTSMSERGIPVHIPTINKLSDDIKDDMRTEMHVMQSLVPEKLRNVSPKNGYTRDIEKQQAFKKGLIFKSGDGYRYKEDDFDLPVVKRVFPVAPKDGVGGVEYVERYAKLLPFKPSNDQLIRYMKHKGHTVPMKKVKDLRRKVETTDQKELVKLYRKTKDPLYSTVLNYKGCETALTRYVEKFTPSTSEVEKTALALQGASDYGLIHSEFLPVPATGQLASYHPNVQNFIKHAVKDGVNRKYADRLRSMVVALPGHKLIEADYVAFHALTTGFEARDADYMRLARLDPHSFLTAHYLYLQKQLPFIDLPDLSWSDDDLKKYLKGIKANYKAIRDLKCKPAILGTQFGMGANKLYELNQDSLTLKDAKKLIKLLEDLFPVSLQWRKDIKLKADKDGYLISRYGFIRWFWDVFTRKKVDGAWKAYNGSDAEDAIAFLPANDAHCHIQEIMIDLEYNGCYDWFRQQVVKASGSSMAYRYKMINMIHDALLFMVPCSLIDEAVPLIKGVMEKHSTVLVDSVVAPKGLSVGVEMCIGDNWSEMDKI